MSPVSPGNWILNCIQFSLLNVYGPHVVGSHPVGAAALEPQDVVTVRPGWAGLLDRHKLQVRARGWDWGWGCGLSTL